MKKRLTSMLLVLCMVVTLFPQTAFAAETGTPIGTSSVTEGAPLPQGGLPPAQTETTPTNATDVPVTGVTLTPLQITLVAGTTEQLTATVSPDNATNKTLTWMSSDPSVAVDATGRVTAVAVGEAFITATAADGSGQSAECTVTVTHPPNTITTALDFTGKAAQDCTNTTDTGNLHDNHTHDGGTPCWSWDPDANDSDKGALTLNGINLLVPGNIPTPALTVPKDTTIVLTDGSTNFVKLSDAVTNDSIGLSGAGGGILTITGSGTLTAQSNQSTQKGSYGIYVGSGSELRITGNAQVNATCASSAALNSVGIFCDRSAIHISGGAKVFAQGGGSSSTSYGIYCAADDSTAIAVTIEGANTQVEAFGTNASTSSRNSNYGIASYGGTKISGGAAVTAKGGTAYKDSIGIYSGAALTIERATVTAIGGTCNNGGTSPASESVGISGNTTLAVTNATVLAQANTCAVRWKESVTCPNASIMASTDGGSTYATPAYLNTTEHYISLTSATTATPAKDVKIMPASYPVTLNNGGTDASGSGSYAQGTTVSINAGSRSGYTFSGWTSADVTFADASSAATTFTMPDKAVTVTANWTYNGGGGGDTGGGKGSSNIIVTPPAPDDPNAPTQAEIKLEGKTDASGNLTITVTDQDMTEAIAKAEADAKKNGNTAKGIAIVLSATGGKNAQRVTVNLPKTVQDTIISKNIVNTMIVVDNPDVQIGMDLAAVTEINTQAKADVNITAKRLDSGTLTGAAQAAIGSRPVFDFAVNYGRGKQVRSFGAGGVSVSIPYTLGAQEKAGNVCAVYVDDSGKVQWITSSVYDSDAKAVRFVTDHFSTYGVGYRPDAPTFTDIEGHWAKDDILFAAEHALLSGTESTVFSPDTSMTRGMFVTALGRLANADVSGYKTSAFGDVAADSYYLGYIEWARENGIAGGYDGKFMPDQSITREQMAVILHNYAKAMGSTLPKIREEAAFADSGKVSGYAQEAVKAMQMAGILSGRTGNVFDPQGTATRAEAAAVLRRFAELSTDAAQQ